MNRSFRVAWPLAAFIALSAVFPNPANAQAPKTFVLKFNHVLGPKEPYHEGRTTKAS
jgi:TRAP-type transport system periplasmic protein